MLYFIKTIAFSCKVEMWPMETLYKKFYHALAWNGIESIAYHSILLCHQMMLFYVVGSSFYGLIGSVFSFIYLSLALSNFGLDDSLAPFFSLSTSSKTHFKRLLLPQLIPECIILTLLALSIFALGPKMHHSFIKEPINGVTLLILGGIIVCEGIKKTIRALLQIAFLSRRIAYVELIAILAYVTIVWGSYAYGYALTLTLLFAPLLLTSFVGCLVLGRALYELYKKLPDASNDPIACSIPRRIIKNRFFAYLTQINHQFFSGNFLVPMFAMHFGLSHAGVLKLTSHIVHTISAIIHKTFGPTSFALLAHHKNMDMIEKRKAFYMATGYIHQALYGILLFFAINYKKLLMFHAAHTHHTHEVYWPLILFFITLHFSEHFFIMYEKFYITEEKIEYLFLLNCLSTLSLYLTIYHRLSFAPFTILLLIFLIRVGSFGIVHFLSFRLWKLKPDFMMRPFYFFASLTFSLAISMLI